MIISIQLVFFYYFDFFAVKQELDFELKLQLLQIDLLLLLQCLVLQVLLLSNHLSFKSLLSLLL